MIINVRGVYVNVELCNKILRRLENVLDGGHTTERGLCFNLCVGLNQEDKYLVQGVIIKLSFEWPKFSSNIAYPVPCPLGGYPDTVFVLTKNMYEGEYGKLRLELAQFMINQLGEILNARTKAYNNKTDILD